MSKYRAIKMVNDWRKYWHKQPLPNYSPQKTIYYDKISFYVRNQGAVEYDFAMGAFLFEIEAVDILNLNIIRPEKPVGNFILYEREKDKIIISNIFQDPELKGYVLTNNREKYDSAQSKIYGKDEWFEDKIARQLESDVLDEENLFSKSAAYAYERKIQNEAKKRYGSEFISARVIYD